jgi:hypothetical protein
MHPDSYRILNRRFPFAFDLWLYYHFDLLGLTHMYVHDLGDSFRSVMQPYIDSGRVTYVPHFGRKVSPTMENLTAQRGLGMASLEQIAFDRCLMHARGRYRFAVVLGVDDFLVPATPGLGIQDLVLRLASSEQNSFLLERIHFGPCLSGSQRDAAGPNLVMRRHRCHTTPGRGGVFPVVDPVRVDYLDSHSAVPRYHDFRSLAKPWNVRLDPRKDWKIHHYPDTVGDRYHERYNRDQFGTEERLAFGEGMDWAQPALDAKQRLLEAAASGSKGADEFSECNDLPFLAQCLSGKHF